MGSTQSTWGYLIQRYFLFIIMVGAIKKVNFRE